MKVKWLLGVTEGQRVVVARDLDFQPFFTIRGGSTGVVVFVNAERGNCSVRMDEPVEGMSEHWANEVYFNVEGAEAPHAEWYTLEQVCWPLPNRGASKDAGT